MFVIGHCRALWSKYLGRCCRHPYLHPRLSPHRRLTAAAEGAESPARKQYRAPHMMSHLLQFQV